MGSYLSMMLTPNTGMEILIIVFSSAIMAYFIKFMNTLRPYQRQPIMYFFLEGITLFTIAGILLFYYNIIVVSGGDVVLAESIRIVSRVLIISAYLVFLGMSWMLYEMVRRV